MALSQKGEALKAKNKANQQAFAETQAPTVSASVTPEVANIGGQPVAPVAPVDSRFTKENFNKIAGVGTIPTTPEVGAINPSAPTVQMQSDSAKIEPPAPVSPVSAPVVPATMQEPVAPVAPVAKAEPPKFITDTQRREQLGEVDKQASRDQMIANVGIMAKEDAGVLTDRAKFNAKTSYDTKPPEEKAILDQYFNANTPTTAGDIKKQLLAGVEIKDPKILNTPAYRQAKFEKERLSRYAGMSSEQLFNEMKTGLPTVVSEALRGTPAYQEAMAKFDQFKKVDNINQTSKFLVTGKGPEKDPLAELSAQLSTIFNQQDETGSTAEAYRAFISNNPEITEPTAEYNTKMGQKKEFERAREALVEDLKKKYAGEPLSTILSIAARESKPINDQINTLNDSLSTLSADIKFKTDLATQEFGFYTQDQQAKAAKQAKLQDLLGGIAVSQFGREQDQAFTREQQAQNQAFDIQKMDIQNQFQNDRDTQNYMQDLQKMGINNIYDLQKMSASQDFQKELASINNKYENSRSVRDFRNSISKLGMEFDLGRQGKALDLQDNMAMEEYKASLDPDKALKWEEVRAKATENSSLADLYGRNVGTYQGNRGYDLAGKMGDAIVAPPGAKVIGVNAINEDGTVSQVTESGGMSIKDPGYGNSVLLQLPDGKFMRLSHLQEIGVNIGDTLAGGQMVGTRGNTGNVVGKNGEKLTAEQLAQGRGAHVDVEIANDSTFGKGSLLNQTQQLEYLKSIKPFGKTETVEAGMGQYSDSDIAIFNSAKYNPQTDKDIKRVERYNNFVNERAVAQANPETAILDLMKFSRGQTNLGQAENKAYKDIGTVVGQLGSLDKSITEYNKQGMFGGTALSPITGLIASKSPWDTKAQQIQAQLQALVPKVARGVFGEVGVLTDQDIANYMKTLPNIKQTADVQDVVQYALLDTLRNSLESAIAIDSGTYDISGLSGQYKKLSEKIAKLESKIIEPQIGGMSTADEDFIKQFK